MFSSLCAAPGSILHLIAKNKKDPQGIFSIWDLPKSEQILFTMNDIFIFLVLVEPHGFLEELHQCSELEELVSCFLVLLQQKISLVFLFSINSAIV